MERKPYWNLIEAPRKSSGKSGSTPKSQADSTSFPNQTAPMSANPHLTRSQRARLASDQSPGPDDSPPSAPSSESPTTTANRRAPRAPPLSPEAKTQAHWIVWRLWAGDDGTIDPPDDLPISVKVIHDALRASSSDELFVYFKNESTVQTFLGEKRSQTGSQEGTAENPSLRRVFQEARKPGKRIPKAPKGATSINYLMTKSYRDWYAKQARTGTSDWPTLVGTDWS